MTETVEYVWTRFARSKDGKTVHRSDCTVRGARFPWQWAEGRSDREIAYTILNTPWLYPCRRCMGGLADAL